MLGYFDVRRDAFTSALAAARAYYAIEGIHQLRVEVKRLRAFYKLIERTAPSFTSKPNAGELKDLYRVAGRLRDIDILQAISVNRLERLDLREYFNQMKSTELKKRPRFETVASRFAESTFTGSRAKIRSALSVMDEDQIRHLMGKRIRKLATKLTKAMGNDQSDHDELHAVRKLSKTLRYTLEVWEMVNGKSPISQDATLRLKNIYGALGDWHDHVVALESLKGHLKDGREKKLIAPRDYTAYLAILQKEIDGRLRAYERGKRPLTRALAELRKSLDRSAEGQAKALDAR